MHQGGEGPQRLTDSGFLTQQEVDWAEIRKSAHFCETYPEIVQAGTDRRDLEQIHHGAQRQREIGILEAAAIDSRTPRECNGIEIKRQGESLEMDKQAASDGGERGQHS